MKHWFENNVHELQIANFWKWLWSMKSPEKSKCFHWLLIHYALLVGDWLRQNQQYAYGMHCGAPTKSNLHVFWLCPMIKQFWSKLFLFLRHHYSRSLSLGVQYYGVSSMEML